MADKSSSSSSSTTTTKSSSASASAAQNSSVQTTGHLDSIKILRVPHLSDYAGKGAQSTNTYFKRSNDSGAPIQYVNYQNEEDYLVYDIVRKAGMKSESKAFVRAGPRKQRYFDSDVVAAIVTCGGLCPGLNNVIKEIVMSLHRLYGVKRVLGIRNGFWGFSDGSEPRLLTPSFVHEIDREGGTILGSNRGGMRGYEEKILEFIVDRKVKMLFVIGGDGTHRGAIHLSKLLRECGQAVVVAGIPKTIDNDVAVIDWSFGFRTAVEEAVRAIHSAKTEAKCLNNGIGIVKVMGRHAGFIACFASIASSAVDLCLLPEIPILMEGPNSHMLHLRRVLKERHHAVVVVAEGAGEELLGASATVDAGGNRKLPKIGLFLKEKIIEYFATTEPKLDVSVKYIDPSYMIRSVKANGIDAITCYELAQNSVHGAMAGFTQFMTGHVNNRLVYLPMQFVVDKSPRKIRVKGRTIERLLAMTGQPQELTAGM